MQISKFLAEQLKAKKGLGSLLNSLGSRYLDAERFQEKFGIMTPEEMVEFILNPDKAYEIGQWSYRQRNPAGRESWLKAKKMLRDPGNERL